MRLHRLELGSGPPLIFLHGFPDCPVTGGAFFAELARSHRVIAPWLRGYAPSPLDGPFDLGTLARDIIELIDDVGGPVDLVGHDWGAAITYAVCALAPDRVRRAVTLALPHPRTFLRRLADPRQLARSWYMFLFQLPGAGYLANARLIDHLWRTWSPGFSLDEGCRKMLHQCLEASMPSPIGYYRAALPPYRLGKIGIPILQLHGANDGCVLPMIVDPTALLFGSAAGPGRARTVDDAHRFGQRVREVLPHVGHFMHLEDPVGIAKRIEVWLR